MTHTRFSKLATTALFFILIIAFAVVVSAQYGSGTKPQGSSQKDAPTLTATLVDPEKKAQQKAATVSVKVAGIKLVDPASVMEKPRAGEGHLHYQVDDGPVIATTTEKLSFHGLTTGPHKIVVMLAANDHSPLGPQQTLEVTIP